MKVYLRPTADDVEVTADEEAAPQAGESGHGGLRGWVERRRARFQNSQGSVMRRLRHLWEWLHRQSYPDEPVLARLRGANSVEVHHHPSLTAEEARSIWSNYLARRRRRHFPWFVFNTVIAPFTVVLAPLPGPNLIGYWFAYRSIHHFLILLGLRKARSGRLETTYHEDTEVAFESGLCGQRA